MEEHMNLKVRVKNYLFWVSIGGLFLTATGASFESLNSWAVLLDLVKSFINNPFQLFTFVVALFGIINNPITKGLKD